LNEAKYSLPYCVALAFLDIPITAQHFLSDAVNTAAIEFSQKINWAPMTDADFPTKFQAEINVHHSDGHSSTARIDQVKGSLDRPASVEEIEVKFIANTSTRFKPSTQTGISDLLMRGDADLPISTLSELLTES
jgi:2-methylcitrate dehydratase PrpD